MTGFDETVPPDPDTDATSADDVGDNVVPPQGGPEGEAASAEQDPADAPADTFGGD